MVPMSANHPLRRFVRVFPVTCWAVLATLILLVMISFETERDRPGPLDWANALTFIELSAIVPIAFLFVIVILVGLLLDSSRISARTGEWDEVVPMSATAFERLAARHFLEAGWEAQRDDEGFKLFVRPRGGRPAVASLAIDPVPGGAQVRMTLSREASEGERLMRVARSGQLPIRGKRDPYELPLSD